MRITERNGFGARMWGGFIACCLLVRGLWGWMLELWLRRILSAGLLALMAPGPAADVAVVVWPI